MILIVLGLVSGCSTFGGESSTERAAKGDVYQVALVSCIGEIHVRATAMAVTEELVATAAHSFDEAIGANLRDRDGQEVKAELVYADFDKDIALLRVSPANGSIFGGAEAIAEEKIRVVSYDDLDLGPEIKTGTVLRTVKVTLDGEGQRRALELEAEIERGDSGGPVVNSDGNAVAMVFASSRSKTRGWAVTFDELKAAIVEYESGAELDLPINCDE